MNFVFSADLHILFFPAGGLNLTDVRLAEEEHTHSRLTDTAAHRKRKLVFKQRLVEGKLCSVVTARNFELIFKGFGINAYTHRRKLKRDIKNGIVNENIAVQRPIVIVGRASVVLVARFKLAAYLHKENRAVLFSRLVFALLGGEVGIFVLKLLRGDKSDLFGE